MSYPQSVGYEQSNVHKKCLLFYLLFAAQCLNAAAAPSDTQSPRFKRTASPPSFYYNPTTPSALYQHHAKSGYSQPQSFQSQPQVANYPPQAPNYAAQQASYAAQPTNYAPQSANYGTQMTTNQGFPQYHAQYSQQVPNTQLSQPALSSYPSPQQAQYAQQAQPPMPTSYGTSQSGLRGFVPGSVTKTSVFRLEQKTEAPPAKDLNECGIAPVQLARRVANGKSTENRQWPWHVQIIINSEDEGEAETYCGGTLINKRFVLTAAHCYDDILHSKRAKSTMLVFKGLDFGKGSSRKDAARLRAKAVHVHHKYVPAMTEYEARIRGVTPGPHSDIALIEIKIDFPELLNKLMPICLPKEEYQMKIGTRCKIMGNGFMNAADEDNFVMPHVLQMADVVVSSNQACRDEVESVAIKSKINSDTVCIRGPIQPCVGDSGGPLICAGKSSSSIQGHEADYDDESDDYSDHQPRKWFLMGVTSFAVSTDEKDKCGHFKSAVFGKVSHYHRWVKSIISSAGGN